MNSIKLGWIDFSKEQRNKVRSVINLLSEPGVVDELGVGIVRDAFADIFFPGTSTIQTRAKYFLIIPYLFHELDKEKNLTPAKMINLINERELDLIDILKTDGSKGVIGETAGRNLRRKPSEIYWNGLRTFEIFSGGRMSLNEYARLYCHISEEKKLSYSKGTSIDKDNDGDDLNAHQGDYIEFWSVPKPNKDWRDSLSMKLSYEEAKYLKKRIINTYPNSLFSYLLESNDEHISLVEDFEHIEILKDNMSADLYQDFLYAKLFSDFLYGIHIRYNVILSQYDEDVLGWWDEWCNKKDNYNKIELDEILIMRLKIKNTRLIRFFNKSLAAIKSQSIDELDELIINREKELKGSQRSKLCNVNEVDYKGWVGIRRLQYRLPISLKMINDIQEGLGDTVV